MITFYFNLDPKTRNEVIAAISIFDAAFEHSHASIASGTFGHIVLDDHNLGDMNILFCLKNETIHEWYSIRESDLYPKTASGQIDPWDLYELDRQRDDIIMFLRWLLTIEEDVRLGDEDEEDE